MPIVIGITSVNASAPIPASTATLRISSVAYATEERLSEAKTASAVGLPRRSCSRLAVGRAGPSNARLTEYPLPCGRAVRLLDAALPRRASSSVLMTAVASFRSVFLQRRRFGVRES